jgi:hypothetical protein
MGEAYHSGLERGTEEETETNIWSRKRERR